VSDEDSVVLQKIAMPLISNPTCETFYGKYKKANEMFSGASISGENAMDITPVTPGLGKELLWLSKMKNRVEDISVECLH
jgi:hypothetical protein